MLASITPLGERGRHSHWTVTVLAFVLGSVSAGAAVGAVLGEAGALAGLRDHGRAALVILAAALVAAIVLDLRARAAPGPRRQVNERWLDQYRGWVYGLGYGAQLGAGVTTVVSSAAMYVALLAAFLVAGALPGAAVVGCYGAIRGLTPLLAARVHTAEQLLALHARLDRARPGAVGAGLAALGGALILALAGAL